ncbi:RND transporter, partial [Burkholderia territorii]
MTRHPQRGARRTHARQARGLAATLAVCMALAGCTVGPDFKPPQAEVPANWHDLQAPAAASAASAPGAAAPSSPVTSADPDPRWWRAFGDPLLDRLVE